MADIGITIGAAIHELRCRRCRVTWKSWAQRLFGIRAGFVPGRGFDPRSDA